MNKQEIKALKRRYLIWLYKTTKEALDKIERKFTQLEIDRFVFEELKKKDRTKTLRKFIAEFAAYIELKEKDGLNLKFKNQKLKPEYRFLVLKLKAIEKAITKEFGIKELKKIKALYEQEMTERILKSMEH